MIGIDLRVMLGVVITYCLTRSAHPARIRIVSSRVLCRKRGQQIGIVGKSALRRIRRRQIQNRQAALPSSLEGMRPGSLIARPFCPLREPHSIHNRDVTTSAPPADAIVPHAVIFDFGRVLSMQPDMDAHTALVETAGVPDEVVEEHYWAHRHAYDAGELNGVTYWQKVAKGAGFPLTPERLAAFHHHDAIMWANLNAPMLEWAFALQKAGVKTAILSNMGDINLAYMRQHFDWLEGFTCLTWSCELLTAKPDPAIYRHTLDKLGVAANQAIFIDDIQANIVAARSLGIDAIQFTTVGQLRDDLETRGLAGKLPLPEAS
jgi:putative hydrolase of the HAD superfamily